MTYNDKRSAKAFKKRALQQTAVKMEQLAAAFLKETGLKASETCLCQATEMVNNVPVFKLWFSSTKADLQTGHPDIAYQADLLSAIYQFSKGKRVETWSGDQRLEVQGWLDMVADHMQKYGDPTTKTLKFADGVTAAPDAQEDPEFFTDAGATDDHQAKDQETDQQAR